MKNVLYRARQAAFSGFMGVLPSSQKKLTGEKAVLNVPSLLVQKKVSNVLLVTTPGMIRRGTLSELLAALETAGVTAFVFTDVHPDPTIQNAQDAALCYWKNKCQAIVAVGGGSVMDCAKAAGALVANPGKSLKDMTGLMKVPSRMPYFIAVPTTAGTGSEVTAAAVITEEIIEPVSGAAALGEAALGEAALDEAALDEAALDEAALGEAALDEAASSTPASITHYKHPIDTPNIVPDVAILDPLLTLTLPPSITADTGMDALTHAVEAYTNRFCQPQTARVALRAVENIFEYLPLAYADGSNVDARMKLLEASYDGGYAITHNFVGYVHAIAHAIGALYGVQHGRANAILLPVVLENYGDSISDKLRTLAATAGISASACAGSVASQRTEDPFIDAIRKLNNSFGIPATFDCLKEENFDTIVERALKEANPDYPVPVIWGREEILKVLRQVVCK